MKDWFTEEQHTEGLTQKCLVCKMLPGVECESAIHPGQPTPLKMHHGRIEIRSG